jgi:hypothetical protein
LRRNNGGSTAQYNVVLVTEETSMCINDNAIEQEAKAAVVEVAAVKPCPVHRDVLIKQCNPEAATHVCSRQFAAA